jgi:hypothetical protein
MGKTTFYKLYSVIPLHMFVFRLNLVCGPLFGHSDEIKLCLGEMRDRLCGLVVRVLGYRSGGPGSIPGTSRFSEKKKEGKQVVGLERGPLSLVSTTEELLDRKVAAPV